MSANSGPGSMITCPSCQQRFPAQIEQIIDVGRDPATKGRFLSGQSSTVHCPHCGYRAVLGTPVLYHDPAKELFLVYVPMELGLQQAERERIIGSLVKTVMDHTPNEQKRGYMFQPRTMLSIQGMMETILEADGVTPEMLEEQRAKVRLVESFLQSDQEDLPALVDQHDDRIDMEFFLILNGAAQNAVQSGRQDMAQHVLDVRDRLMELSTAGQEALRDIELQEEAIQDVTEALQALGDQATREDFMDLVFSFAEDDQRLQALVGLQYPLFDYAFFMELSGLIEQADGDDRAFLEALHERLLELTNLIRQQQEAAVQASVQVLRDILRSPDLDEAIRRHVPALDDTFMMVLAANIQSAESSQDVQASARLKQVYERVMAMINQNVPPELRFVSDLLQQESFEDARALIDAEAAQFGPELLEIMDLLMADLEARGDESTVERLAVLRDYVASGMPAP